MSNINVNISPGYASAASSKVRGRLPEYLQQPSATRNQQQASPLMDSRQILGIFLANPHTLVTASRLQPNLENSATLYFVTEPVVHN